MTLRKYALIFFKGLGMSDEQASATVAEIQHVNESSSIAIYWEEPIEKLPTDMLKDLPGFFEDAYHWIVDGPITGEDILRSIDETAEDL